jgi:hypothetical protein
MPLQATSGAASYDAFGGGVPVPKNYIEDVFSTWLYTGNGSTQTINNGIDLSTKGGMVWIKQRAGADLFNHGIYDTARGATLNLQPDTTSAQTTQSTSVTAFSTTGFSIGSYAWLNTSTYSYASWTFREQPKFFDIVTWTGNGVDGRNIAHNLGSTPGCIMIKRLTGGSGQWAVWHRSIADPTFGGAAHAYNLNLSTTGVPELGNIFKLSSFQTSTNFRVSADTICNASGSTYVAYLFAHDAGGFGLTGTDNVISCGSYTGNGTSENNITLGYEPQWLMIKNATSDADWFLFDTMRGLPVGLGDVLLSANLSSNESTNYNWIDVGATGFKVTTNYYGLNTSGATYIYIAIRRGPMKVPTTGTSVFAPVISSSFSGTAITTGFPVDMQIAKRRTQTTSFSFVDRLRGVSTNSTQLGSSLASNTTSAETSSTGSFSNNWSSNGYLVPSAFSSVSSVYWNFKRAPSFFDEVCYTGTGVARTVAHNLGVVPELIIIKCRNATTIWPVYSSALLNTEYLALNSIGPKSTSTDFWNSTSPTSSVFTVGTDGSVNANSSAQTYVAYLFATCPGVSKVGSYVSTGGSQSIDCGFTSGARFVMIKRATSDGGDWFVFDTARGIVAGNDPYLMISRTDVEVTGQDYIDPISSGFQISSTAPVGMRASGQTYIFLAIA